jgi:hypothetical protein
LWWEHGLRDPRNVFKKNEGEKISKKYGRIVNGESIVDQIVQRMMFMGFSEAEGAAYPRCPNMKGVGFDPPNADKVTREFQHLCASGVPAVGSDVAGWEKGFSLDCADAFGTVFARTCTNYYEYKDEIECCLHWWMFSLLGNLCVDTDGYIYVLLTEQGMSSGNILTTSANGAARLACALDAGSVTARCNGDDCVEWTNLATDELIRRYRSNNVEVRDVIRCSKDSWDFCSHTFAVVGGRRICYQSNVNKMVFNILSMHTTDANTLLNVYKEVVDHPDNEFVRRFMYAGVLNMVPQ